MDQNREHILRKIKKALILAKNNSFVHESQTALLLAQKLMLEHGITATEVKEMQVDKKEVLHSDITPFGRTPWWKKSLGSIIAENFRCSIYIQRVGKKNRLIFLGLQEDVEIASEVYRYAEASLQYHAWEYCRSIKNRIKTRKVHNRYRNKFILGYLTGLRSKFKEQVQRHGWGLVLMKDALIIAEEEKMNMPIKKSKSPALSRSEDAFQKGFVKGRRFEKPTGLLYGNANC